MGILRNQHERKLFKVEEAAAQAQQEHQITYADYIFDDTESEHSDVDEDVSELRESPRCRPVRRAHLRAPLNMLTYDGPKIKSGMGARKLRRLEHSRMLLSLTDPEDICEDFSDMIPDAMSAFSKLFIEQNNMKVWNEFITLDEVDQQRILDDIDSKHPEKEVKKSKKTKKAKADHGPSSSNSSDDARRAHHPAFSGKACFKRMERRFKDLMLQKHLPWSFISATEQALVDFFNCDPNGVWVGTLLNPNHRLYLHAVAQYLSLFSESTTDSTDQRVTEVRNTRDNFVSPNITLLEYVSEQKKKRKSKAVE